MRDRHIFLFAAATNPIVNVSSFLMYSECAGVLALVACHKRMKAQIVYDRAYLYNKLSLI